MSTAYVAKLAALASAVALAVVAAGWIARDRPEPPYRLAGASAERGRVALAEFGCRTCHTIPGAGACAPDVGPPLAGWSRRRYIAGRLPNNPPNLVRWITDPQAVVPGNAMPDVGVSVREARDIAAYLYDLR
jgi:cytochrome c